ncbi:N5-glutamine methyltransferase family protein [Phytoactinopolyspora halotolerans]|uniref:Peptide chain release factor N(5)-glutamine methyltransferase n=1 Tax=Phytoactinopolyspora halotolerans TaxID=1981512 RepID=A0A6L9S6H0_9ACTN|nr:HemK/PrmC family methyltransferase [Phytoactinopolyspora halotolerans]NEE00563.1 peptide chain release factor N(5)-glutamine methyltransferase [Phytoactinopolyspora halotolerans]
MSLREQIRDAAARLADAGVPSPQHDAEVLAAHVLGIERSQLAARLAGAVSSRSPGGAPAGGASAGETAVDAETERFTTEYGGLVARRAAREPLQHITGVAHFRHLTLNVGPGVFTPRPETELTAGAAIAEAQAVVADGRVPVVIDMFAGSGAIAISVAREVRPCVVHAVESEDDAIEWLRKNAAGQSVVVHRDDVGGIVDRSMSMLLGSVDVVVANPPYVPVGAVIRDPEVVEHDPAAALWSGEDGLDAMRTLESVAARLLRPGGLVVAEHADEQGESAPAVFHGSGRWDEVVDHLDLNQRPRYVTARLAAAG